jgi:YVTN family beta-propeller protein
VGGSPDMLQVSPDGKELWATNRFGDSVTVASTKDGRVLHVIVVGREPHGLAYFPQPGRYCIGHNGVFR